MDFRTRLISIRTQFAEFLLIFVNGETGTVSRQLEKNAAGFGKIDGLEPEAIDPQTDCQSGCVIKTGAELKTSSPGLVEPSLFFSPPWGFAELS